MRALVTRPRDDAEATAALLRQRGYDVLIEPLLDIVHLANTPLDASSVQGILATSANGIRALADRLADRALPVWAVGDSSARAARRLGYSTVHSAEGDVDSLAALVAGRVDPAAGPLLHAAASDLAGDLAGQLAKTGHQVRRVVLYEARTATALSTGLTAALAEGGLDVALFFSPRTAATFVTLVEAAGLAGGCVRIAAYGLSPAVATRLAALPWRSVIPAAAPTQAALLAALDDDQTRLAAAHSRQA
jgi:uroporphyrinogen-III synthase